MKQIKFIIISFVLLIATTANATEKDSIFVKSDSTISLSIDNKNIKIDSSGISIRDTSEETFKPNPARAVWMGAIIPGYGQIVNRSYWKLPIVYAGFLGCAYAITLNSSRYGIYKQAYRDITDSNDATKSYEYLFPDGYDISSFPGGMTGLENNLKSFYEQYRRYRDMSIIITVAYYALTLVEAYVDAQLFDFDISTDLSMHLRPALMQSISGRNTTPGVQISLNLK
ncbi:MAG: DUF5683 domain-containing protein [Paludibacter sp.]